MTRVGYNIFDSLLIKDYINLPLSKSGIYKIENFLSNKVYIGSAINIRRRIASHFSELKRNIHHNEKLQRAWNKYGEDKFIISIILPCHKEYLIIFEQWFIDYYNSVEIGYNITPIAGSTMGRKHSPETKEKLRKFFTGKRHSIEARKKMSLIRKGRKISEQHARNISFGKKGKKRKPFSDEWLKKLSVAKKGKKFSETHRKNLAEANRKRWLGVKKSKEEIERSVAARKRNALLRNAKY